MRTASAAEPRAQRGAAERSSPGRASAAEPRAQRGAAERSSRGLRCFFAIELGTAARREAGGLAQALAAERGGDGVRWVRPEALHVTLRFLGEVEPERIPVVVGQVRAVTSGHASFTLRLGALRAFPSPRRPRVVALALEPVEPLAELAAAVETGVVAAGFEPESRRYKPHLTLGRVRGGRLPALDHAIADPAPFPVHEVVLFRSELSPRGSLYTSLERIALEGDASP